MIESIPPPIQKRRKREHRAPRLDGFSWRRRWQRARHVWRYCLIILVNGGRRLWWPGAMAAAGLLSLWAAAIAQMAVGTDGLAPTLKDWLIVPLLLGPVMAMLALMICARLQKAFGHPALALPGRTRRWLRPSLSYIDNKLIGFVWFLNGVGCIAMPFVVFWLFGSILKIV